MTPDQRENIVSYGYDKGSVDMSALCFRRGEKVIGFVHGELADVIHEALTAPPQVPQEVVTVLKEAKDHAEKAKHWAGYTYLEVSIAKIDKALTLLTQGRE